MSVCLCVCVLTETVSVCLCLCVSLTAREGGSGFSAGRGGWGLTGCRRGVVPLWWGGACVQPGILPTWKLKEHPYQPVERDKRQPGVPGVLRLAVGAVVGPAEGVAKGDASRTPTASCSVSIRDFQAA